METIVRLLTPGNKARAAGGSRVGAGVAGGQHGGARAVVGAGVVQS